MISMASQESPSVVVIRGQLQLRTLPAASLTVLQPLQAAAIQQQINASHHLCAFVSLAGALLSSPSECQAHWTPLLPLLLLPQSVRIKLPNMKVDLNERPAAAASPAD